MPKFPMKALVAAVFLLILAATASLAAGSVTIRVTENGRAVDGIAVEIYASNGATTYVTDANGEVAPELTTRYFRIKVNGVLQSGLHNVDEGTITVRID